MAIYLDANVIAALLLSEPTSPHVADMLRREEEFAVGDFTSAEVAAVISRRVRTGEDTNGQAVSRLEGLDRLRAWAGAAEPLEDEAFGSRNGLSASSTSGSGRRTRSTQPCASATAMRLLRSTGASPRPPARSA